MYVYDVLTERVVPRKLKSPIVKLQDYLM